MAWSPAGTQTQCSPLSVVSHTSCMPPVQKSLVLSHHGSLFLSSCEFRVLFLHGFGREEQDLSMIARSWHLWPSCLNSLINHPTDVVSWLCSELVQSLLHLPRGRWEHKVAPKEAWLQAVYFLRPTRENIARLRRELRSPRFSEYNLCKLSLPCDAWKWTSSLHCSWQSVIGQYSHTGRPSAADHSNVAAISLKHATCFLDWVNVYASVYCGCFNLYCICCSFHQSIGRATASRSGRHRQLRARCPSARILRRLWGHWPTSLRLVHSTTLRCLAALQLGVCQQVTSKPFYPSVPLTQDLVLISFLWQSNIMLVNAESNSDQVLFNWSLTYTSNVPSLPTKYGVVGLKKVLIKWSEWPISTTVLAQNILSGSSTTRGQNVYGR